MMHKIKVVDYNPKWAHAFKELKDALLHHVSEDLHIEHVGSTSVPGLAAKAIIDIDIVVKNKADMVKLIPALENLGYIHEGDLGIEGRDAYKRSLKDVPLLKEHHSKWASHHLYVVLEDSVAFKNHMAIKNYMMSDADAVKEYSELKKALAHKYPHDMDSYVKEKTPFILRVLKNAGFDEEMLETVKKANM
jgi:GrpB-like predicted nucleotidyltransferase (UPF0157 family)